ncbi:MAG: ABC transporter ATP-binding protein [Planctomycetaceae bacterium]|nr:ABC transporter ATP-binding protein [Planctomycetaceae bacterium]
MLELTNVSKTYQGASGPVQAVKAVSLTLEAGQFVAVQGPSGCGKSTLLLMAGGLMHPDQGTVRVGGVDPYTLPPDKRATFRGEKIGFVFQQFHLVPYLSVLDNVLAAALATGSSTRKEVSDRARQLVDQFGLSHRMHHVPNSLSSGERQRTALARALLNEPSHLLADEPTGNLDRENAETVLNAMSDFASAGGTVLLVTHDDLAASRAQTVLTMRAGELETSSPATAATR